MILWGAGVWWYSNQCAYKNDGRWSFRFIAIIIWALALYIFIHYAQADLLWVSLC